MFSIIIQILCSSAFHLKMIPKYAHLTYLAYPLAHSSVPSQLRQQTSWRRRWRWDDDSARSFSQDFSCRMCMQPIKFKQCGGRLSDLGFSDYLLILIDSTTASIVATAKACWVVRGCVVCSERYQHEPPWRWLIPVPTQSNASANAILIKKCSLCRPLAPTPIVYAFRYWIREIVQSKGQCLIYEGMGIGWMATSISVCGVCRGVTSEDKFLKCVLKFIYPDLWQDTN